MPQFDPMQMLKIIMSGGNPQQMVMNYLESNSDTPIGANLLNLAKNNQYGQMEQIARNICQQRGIDFDKEFPAFKQMLGM